MGSESNMYREELAGGMENVPKRSNQPEDSPAYREERIMEPSIEERVIGSVLGFGIGDAVGAPLEFMNSPRVVSGYERSPHKGLKEGQFTDDFQHYELALDSCLANTGKVNLEDQGRRLVRWYTSGEARSMGRTTELAMQNLLSGISPKRSGIKNENSSGSLALSRLIPFSILSALRPYQEKITHGETRKILGVTHAHRNVSQMGFVVNYLIQETMHGRSLEETTDMILHENSFLNKGIRKKLGVVRDLSKSDKDAGECIEKIGEGGFVRDVVLSALYSVLKYENFRDSVLCAANGRGDSDSRAAIAGTLSGLYNGVQGIPEEWIRGLERSSEIENKAKRLYVLGSQLSFF